MGVLVTGSLLGELIKRVLTSGGNHFNLVYVSFKNHLF